MIIIPSRESKQLTQTNRSKILGSLWSSFNLDLQSDLGTIRLAPRLRINTTGITNQGLSVAFRVFDGRVFSICGTRIFKNSANNLISSFIEDTNASSSGAKSDYVVDLSDLENFNNELVATTGTKVVSKAANGSGTGAWTERGGGITAGTVHKLCYFVRHDRIYYIDLDAGSAIYNIKSLSTAWSEATSGDYFISLTSHQGNPYTLRADSTYIWIGTMNFSAVNDQTSGASILIWDGKSSQVTSEYRIKANGILALCPDNKGVMHAIDSNGALLAFNGNGFDEIGRLPLNREMLINANSGTYNGFIHPNGLIFSKNGTFMVLINNLVGDSGGTISENLPSGIWEFTKQQGFIHRQSVNYAILGNSNISDYGQNRISAAGALAEPNLYSASASGKPTLICGVTRYTDASLSVSSIFVDDPLDVIQKFGYFVTSWIFSGGLKDTWQKIALRYRQLLDSSDKFIIKYRTRESSSFEISITWVNTSTFTTLIDVSALIGYEVEIIQGTGSGKCSHIASVVRNGSIYTVIIDETYTGVTTGTSKARLQNWKKHFSISNQITESNITSLGKSSERIQLKVCMQFTGEDELYETILINSPHEALE